MNRELIISCEHAGNEVPSKYNYLFETADKALESHRGFDIGALELTGTIAELLKQEPYVHTVSRLLIDLNRSIDNPTLFSEYTVSQPEEVREKLFHEFYLPHRDLVEGKIRDITRSGVQVIHLSVHTFTPVLDNERREVDVGFLFDPSRRQEYQFCREWRNELQSIAPGLTLKMNAPYHGTMDGFTTQLRETYTEEQYLGIEIEVNQRFAESSSIDDWLEVQRAIAHSLHTMVAA